MDWDKCQQLSADIVILDKEENTREMAEACPLPWVATHITEVDSVGVELDKINQQLQSDALANLASQWKDLARTSRVTCDRYKDLPGFIKQIGSESLLKDRVEYLIWRNPWMGIGRGTFIASVLEMIGIEVPDHNKPYPELAEEALHRSDTSYLFSTEPYPFEQHLDKLESLGVSGALIDAEVYSWFGARSYRLLRDFMDSRLEKRE